MQAAKYLGVAPWDLVEKPQYWTNVGLICMQAEAEHQQKQQEKQQRKAKRRGGQ